MISAIRGKIFSHKPGIVELECANGVIYKIFCPVSLYYDYSQKDELLLFTALRVKDDLISLYGFPTFEEKEVFIKLTGVSGVGYKTALSIISSLGVKDLLSAIEKGEAEKIYKVPGIGKKTAQRLILELSGKLSLPDNNEVSKEEKQLKEDLISALLNLGYSPKNSQQAVDFVLKDNTDIKDFELLFKKALKKLSR